jgi:hypothetical protein
MVWNFGWAGEAERSTRPRGVGQRAALHLSSPVFLSSFRAQRSGDPEPSGAEGEIYPPHNV